MQTDRGHQGAEQQADAFREAVGAVDVLPGVGDQKSAQIRAAFGDGLKDSLGRSKGSPVVREVGGPRCRPRPGS